MDKKILLITKIVVFSLVAIALVFQILMIAYNSIFQSPTAEALDSSILGGYLNVAYIALAIAIIVALIFPVIQMISSPKNAIKALIGVGVIVVLGLISYLFASNDFSPQQLDKLQITVSTSIWVSAGINLAAMIGGLAIVAVIVLTIKGSFSK
jgi:hypothetical protein